MNQTTIALDEIFNQEPDAVIVAVQERIRTRLDRHQHSVIVFGTGQLGRMTLEGLRRIGKPPVAFADNNPALRGATVEGVVVLSPDEARREFPESLFCVAVYTNAPVLEQLRGMGSEFITFAELAWCYPNEFPPHGAVEFPHKIFAEEESVRAAFDLWRDDVSREEYLGQLRWRTTLDPATLPAHSPVEETYFPSDLFEFQPDDVFVDCGAFNGDSIRAFLQRVGDNFGAAVGLEPDPQNRKNFEAWRATLPESTARKVQVLPYASSAKAETLRFDSTGTAGSALGAGEIEVEARPLDQVAAEFHPTFIKMDIEGAEPAAVTGATGIIQKQQPIMAVCLYHAQEHLWQIPLLIQRLNPEYKLFLRRYSDECWEIVCYAVPAARLKQPTG